MPDGGRETRVRVKCGHFAGREGTLVEPQPGDAPGKLRVRFDTGLAGFFKYDEVEFLPTCASGKAQPFPEGFMAGQEVRVNSPPVGLIDAEGVVVRLCNRYVGICVPRYTVRLKDGMVGRGGQLLFEADFPATHLALASKAEARLDPREPEPVRDIPAVLAGIGRWQQQDPMKRRVHFVAEPVTYGNIRGHVVTLHVVFPGDQSPYLMTITAPATEAEVVAALDRLVAQPPGTRASMTTPDAEALATHAGGTD